MYIVNKKIKDKKTGRIYRYCQLVETISISTGKKQRVVLHLGQLDLSADKIKILGKMIELRIRGIRESSKFPELEKIADEAYQKYLDNQKKEVEKKKETEAAHYVEIDLKSTNQTQYRSVGCETVCNHLWRELHLSSILRKCKFSWKEIDLAKVIIFGRLIAPGSELSTINWFFNQSSLLETLSSDLKSTGKDAFYEISDLLYANKDKIEHHLRENTKKLFPYSDTIYLYDLTNTYFEGRKLNSKLCKRGKSKEKRTDCPLVTLALVVDQHGFPIHSRIYRGNQSEPSTMQEIIAQIYDSNEDYLVYLEKPAIAMDRGIATKANLDYLKQNGYSYFIIERRDVTKLYKEEFSDIQEAGIEHTTKSKQQVYLKRIDEENCTRVLVYSPRRKEKESAIIGRKEERFIEDVNRLILSIEKGTLKNENKIQLRIGRIKERFGAISSLYDIKLTRDTKKKGYISKLKLEKKITPPINKKKNLPGCYVIETDRKNIETEEIWKFYMTLHEVESAFRAIKTDLGTRPIYHQLDSRIESHLFISVLSYTILKSVLFSLREKGKYTAGWTTIRQKLSNHLRSTTVQTAKSGDVYHTRVTGIPEKDAKEIYDILNIPVKANRKISFKSSA